MFVVWLLFFLHIGAMNYIHGLLALSVLTIFFYQYLKKRRYYVNAFAFSEIWILACFGITYVLFGEISTLYIEYYLLAPVMAFLTGWVYCECTKDAALAIKKALFAILLAFGIHILLNISINIGHTRLGMRDFFQGKRIATGSGALNTMIVSLLMYSIFLAKGREKIILCTLLGISLVYCFILGNRTQFAILLLVNTCTIGVYMYEQKGARGLFKAIYIIGGTALVLLMTYTLNIFGIRELIDKSNFMLRFIINDYTGVSEASTSVQGRIKLLENALAQIFANPLGGNIGRSYYHNLILDIARVAGIIPMLLMILYLFKILQNLYRIFRSGHETNLRYMLLSIYLGFLLNFLVEPVLEGLIEYFLMMCMIDGMLSYMAYRQTPRMLVSGRSHAKKLADRR